MRRLLRFVVVLGLLALVFLWILRPGAPSIAERSILLLDLSGEYVEAAEPPLLSRLFAEPRRPFVSLLSELAKAERDDRLAAVVLRIRGLEIGWAKAQELREAIAQVAERGRRVVAYLELESLGSNLDYYVATAAEQVYASPASHAPIPGLGAEFLFLGGLWEHLGLRFEVEKIGRYKTAADMLTGREMTDANREMANALLDSLDAQFVAGIAESRGLSEEQVRAAIAAAPFAPDELITHRLIDGALFLDELVKELGEGPLVRGAEYAGVDPASVGFAPVARFALVYGAGAVVTGDGSSSSAGNPVLASDSVSRALDAAARDSDVAAIIFRIDSPGGSALAADLVWRAAARARQEGKPLIASFSDIAASGGYYAAAGADAIVASPGSVTGSIGVFVLRPILGGVFDKLGIGFESLMRGPHADLRLLSRPLSEASRERLRAEVASIYDLFVARVAEGRSLSPESVDAIARGRVWTGAQAAERALVDELGGLRAAVRRAKRTLDIDPEADVALSVYPPPKSVFEQVEELLRGARAGLLDRAEAAQLRRLEPWLEAAAQGGPMALLPFAFEVR